MMNESFIVVELALKSREVTPVPGKRLTYIRKQEKFVAVFDVVAVTVILVALTRKSQDQERQLVNNVIP